MTEKTIELTEELGKITNKAHQNAIFATLFSVIGADFEMNAPGIEKILCPDMDTAWLAANEHMARAAKEGPEKAFEAAIDIAMIPESSDPKQEEKNAWIRGTGLAALGLDKNKVRLSNYLEKGDRRDDLSRYLIENMDMDLTSFKTPDDFSNPNGFLTLQSIYIGIGLKDDKSEISSKIFNIAQEKKALPETKIASKAISTFPECKYIADRV